MNLITGSLYSSQTQNISSGKAVSIWFVKRKKISQLVMMTIVYVLLIIYVMVIALMVSDWDPAVSFINGAQKTVELWNIYLTFLWNSVTATCIF